MTQVESESAPVAAPIASVENIPSASQPGGGENSATPLPTEQWQQILANLQPMSTRELLRQMGHLIEFNDNVARIGMRSAALCDRAKAYLPNIKAAFEATFKQSVQVKLELATTSQTKKTPVKEPPVTSSANVPPPGRRINQPVASHSTNHASSQAITQPQADTVGKSTTSPVAVSNNATSTSEWDDHEVAIASQRLAEFFKGEVVGLDDDTFAQPLAISSLPPPTDSDFYNVDADDDADPGF